ncbi:hypothetical protein HPB50_003891 [Hyalomma asiaticum]|uniref:Uncharacterized protein n=1 Tax=Hyalomma asiaticum TaxID=266040 RepID=A0ACB7RSI5_HYAAI|nr:hypothetical protein HPB50_003891 [Hyalomma asiaticum]
MAPRASRSPLRPAQSSARTSGRKQKAPLPNHNSFGITPSLPHTSSPKPGRSQEIPRLELFAAITGTSTTSAVASSAEAPFGFFDGRAAACGGWMPTPPSSLLVPPVPQHGDFAATQTVVKPTPCSQQPAFPCMQAPPPTTKTSSPLPGTTVTTGKCGDTFKAYPVSQAHLVEFGAFSEKYMPESSRDGPPDENTCSKTVTAASAAAPPCPSLTNSTCRLGSDDEDGDRTSSTNSNSPAATVPSSDEMATSPNDAEGTGSGNILAKGASAAPLFHSASSSPPLNYATRRWDSCGIDNCMLPKKASLATAICGNNGEAIENEGLGRRTSVGGGSNRSNDAVATSSGPVRNGRKRSRPPEREESLYWERRRKSKEASQRCRAALKAREHAIYIQPG